MMAGLDQIPGGSTASIVSNDAFHDVSDVTPFHLAHIFNTCSAGAACVLNATTVDMLMFETLESEDTGFVSISAVEMRVKLKSREAFWQAAGVANVDSNATDLTGSRCKEINAAALAWAVSAAAPATMARYTKIGEPYVMGDDVNSPIGITGPTWIKKALQYNRQTNGPNGRSFVEVVSPRFFVKNKNDGESALCGICFLTDTIVLTQNLEMQVMSPTQILSGCITANCCPRPVSWSGSMWTACACTTRSITTLSTQEGEQLLQGTSRRVVEYSTK